MSNRQRNRQRQPMQDIVLDKDNSLRFRENAIVQYLIDHGSIDLNQIAELDFPDEDREQLAQLIGYSISGYHELSYVSDESAKEASMRARILVPNGGGCRDAGCVVHGGPLFESTSSTTVTIADGVKKRSVADVITKPTPFPKLKRD